MKPELGKPCLPVRSLPPGTLFPWDGFSQPVSAGKRKGVSQKGAGPVKVCLAHKGDTPTCHAGHSKVAEHPSYKHLSQAPRGDKGMVPPTKAQLCWDQPGSSQEQLAPTPCLLPDAQDASIGVLKPEFPIRVLLSPHLQRSSWETESTRRSRVPRGRRGKQWHRAGLAVSTR